MDGVPGRWDRREPVDVDWHIRLRGLAPSGVGDQAYDRRVALGERRLVRVARGSRRRNDEHTGGDERDQQALEHRRRVEFLQHAEIHVERRARSLSRTTP